MRIKISPRTCDFLLCLTQTFIPSHSCSATLHLRPTPSLTLLPLYVRLFIPLHPFSNLLSPFLTLVCATLYCASLVFDFSSQLTPALTRFHFFSSPYMRLFISAHFFSKLAFILSHLRTVFTSPYSFSNSLTPPRVRLFASTLSFFNSLSSLFTSTHAFLPRLTPSLTRFYLLSPP